MKFARYASIFTLAVAIAACGGGSDSSGSDIAKQEYIDAITAGLENDGSEDTQSFTTAESTCIAEEVVNVIGVDAFVEEQITPEDLAENTDVQMPPVTDAQHEALRKMLFEGDCVNISEKIAESFTGSLGAGATEEDIKCLADTIIEGEAMQNYMVDGLLGIDTSAAQAELSGVVMSAATDCGIDGLGS
jgi:hypothetical protein